MPKFPPVLFELAVVCPHKTAAGQVLQVVRDSSAWIVSAVLKEVYMGSNLPEGSKSLAIHISAQAVDHTLSREESDQSLEDAVTAIRKSGWDLRA